MSNEMKAALCMLLAVALLAAGLVRTRAKVNELDARIDRLEYLENEPTKEDE